MNNAYSFLHYPGLWPCGGQSSRPNQVPPAQSHQLLTVPSLTTPISDTLGGLQLLQEGNSVLVLRNEFSLI